LGGRSFLGVDHDSAYRLGGELDAMSSRSFSAARVRAEVGVAVAEQVADARL
jgi:hypothetical protein